VSALGIFNLTKSTIHRKLSRLSPLTYLKNSKALVSPSRLITRVLRLGVMNTALSFHVGMASLGL